MPRLQPLHTHPRLVALQTKITCLAASCLSSAKMNDPQIHTLMVASYLIVAVNALGRSDRGDTGTIGPSDHQQARWVKCLAQGHNDKRRVERGSNWQPINCGTNFCQTSTTPPLTTLSRSARFFQKHESFTWRHILHIVCNSFCVHFPT